MGTSPRNRSPMDHGYAWIVTIAVFGSNLLIVGFFRSFSVFFVDMVDTFSINYTMASIVMGVQGAVCCVTALIVHNILLDSVGIRTVAVFGGFVFSAGITLAYFADSAVVLVLALGVLVGVGNGSAFGPGTVLVGQYFDKRRALATSLSCMGSSVGSMVLPVLATELVLYYGLRGAFLLYGGLTLHLCVTTSLYRPFPHNARVTRDSDSSAPSPVSSDCESTLLNGSSSSSGGDQSPEEGGESSVGADCHVVSVVDESGSAYPEALRGKVMQIVAAEYEQDSLTVPAIVVNSDDIANSLLRKLCDVEENRAVMPYSRSMPRDTVGNVTSSRLLSVPQKSKASLYFSSQDHFPGHVSTNGHHLKQYFSLGDLSYSSSDLDSPGQSSRLSHVMQCLETASLYASQPHLPAVSTLVSEIGHIVSPVESTEDDEKHVTAEDSSDVKRGTCQKLREMVSCDSQLLRNPLFWIVQVYSGVGFVGCQAAYTYLPSLLREKGLTTGDTAVALTVWGACSFLGRFLCGVLADRQLVRPATMSALTYLVLGTLFFLVALLPRSVETWLAFTVVYGLLEGVYFCLLPVVIIDLLSLQKFASTFGFTRLSQSVTMTVLYPILGQLRDSTGNYHATFYVIGACAFLSSILFVFTSMFRALKSRLAPCSQN